MKVQHVFKTTPWQRHGKRKVRTILARIDNEFTPYATLLEVKEGSIHGYRAGDYFQRKMDAERNYVERLAR